MVREIVDSRFGSLPFADVGKAGDVVGQFALGIVDRRDGSPFRIDHAILAQIPELALPVTGFAQRSPHQLVGFTRGLVRGEDARILAQQFFRAIAAVALKCLVDCNDAVAAIGDQDRLTAVLENLGIKAQGILCTLAVRDVAPGAVNCLATGEVDHRQRHLRGKGRTIDAGVNPLEAVQALVARQRHHPFRLAVRILAVRLDRWRQLRRMGIQELVLVGVTERVDCRIIAFDKAAVLDDPHRIRRAFEHRAQPALRALPERHVAQGLDDGDDIAFLVADRAGVNLQVQLVAAQGHDTPVLRVYALGNLQRLVVDRVVVVDLFQAILDHQVSQARALDAVEGAPVIARTQNLTRRHAGQGLAGLVPDDDLALRVKDERRHHELLHHFRGEAQAAVIRDFLRFTPAPGKGCSHCITLG